jgi:hypothetical protein
VKALALVSILLVLWVSGLLMSGAAAADGPASWPDAPDPAPPAFGRSDTGLPDSYEEALRTWRTPEDIAGWAGSRFVYHIERALQLSETGRRRGQAPAILTPGDLFAHPSGTCLDLARFAVETLQRIDPTARPRYLMIEFEPVQVQGVLLRRHWLATFRRDGAVYAFADSKRPRHVDGPYADTAGLVDAYERYRGRKIVRYEELDTFARRVKTARPGG